MNISAAYKIGCMICTVYSFNKDNSFRYHVDNIISSFNEAYAGHYHISVNETNIVLTKYSSPPIILFSSALY